MRIARVIYLDWAKDLSGREIQVTIDVKDSMYVQTSDYGFPMLINSGPLIEGINMVLESGHHAVNAMKGNTEFIELRDELRDKIRELRKDIKQSNLAARVRQFLSALEYEKLTDFQAKCVLLLEQELK